MKTDDLMHRLRSYFVSKGMNARQTASAAGVNWRTANRLLTGDTNLTMESIRQFERVVPDEYEPGSKPRRKAASHEARA
ncbi:helix-turn-helix domain-containing protein [Azospirillum argentinense]|uniref:Helix-turn-helix domain-containing protein n=1 Tax=Azospirillum argentinense TaxID=2970906 RepID=A0ABW8V4V6_9PROT